MKRENSHNSKVYIIFPQYAVWFLCYVFRIACLNDLINKLMYENTWKCYLLHADEQIVVNSNLECNLPVWSFFLHFMKLNCL